MPNLNKIFVIKAKDFVKAGEVSIKVQGILKEIGFNTALIRRASVCAYEGEMNVVMHGGNGVLQLTVDPENIIIEIKDDGPGIENIKLALQEGYSTATEEYREMGFGAGMGLPNIKNHADSLEIHSKKGEGTYLRISFIVSDSP